MKRVSLFLALVMIVSLLGGITAASAEDQLIQLTALATLNTATEDLNTSEFLKSVAQSVGVQITYECVYTDWAVKKGTLLASGDLPDMFFGYNILSDSDVTANKEYFVTLNDLIAGNAPNISATLEADASYAKMVTALDGSINWLGSRNMHRPSTYTSQFINKAWLDKLGLEIPKTTAELKDVLTAFRDGDPNGNGEADELPMYILMFRNDDAWGIRSLMGAFGVESSINTLFGREGDKIVFRPVQDGFKDYIIYLHELKAEGLMPEELGSVGGDWSTVMGRVGANPPVVGVTNTWTNAFFDPNVVSEYVQLPPLEGPNGFSYVAYNPEYATYDGSPKFILSESCENKEAAIKFVDQFFIGENAVQIGIGPIGTTLENNADGLLELRQPPEGMDHDTFIYSHSMRESWPYYASAEWLDEHLVVPYNDAGKLEYDAVNLPYARTDAYVPPLKFTPEQTEELATLVTDIETFMYTQLVDWFVEGGVEAGWDAYVAELKDIGVDRYIEIYQEAYDSQK